MTLILLLYMHLQVGLNKQFKIKFWKDLDLLIYKISQEERIFLGGDMNEHVRKEAKAYKDIHVNYSFKERNYEGKTFVMASCFMIANKFVINKTSS